MCHQAFAALAVVESLKTQDFPFHLDERHTLHQFRDFVEMPPVDVFVGVILQHVAKRMDVEFFTQNLLTLGTHTRGIHNILT